MSGVFGTWMLVRATSTDGEGKPMPAPYGGAPMGRVTLMPDSRMIAVTCDGRAQVPVGEPRDFSAYCGNATYDGKTLVTRVFAASDPARIGSDQVRDVHFEGKTMVLRPPLRSYGGRPPEQRELWWERISDTPKQATAKPSIVGTWGLTGGTRTAADGTLQPPPYGGSTGLGRVALTQDGRLMCVLCDMRRDIPAGAQREFNSYCGTYTFDGRRLVTKVFANSDPSRLSEDQVREVHLEGKTMILRPPARAAAAGEPVVQREVRWERIADV